MSYQPKYTVNIEIAKLLAKIDELKSSIEALPLTPRVLAGLQESAKLYSTHYSTMIEGNQLKDYEVQAVINKLKSNPKSALFNSEARNHSVQLNKQERDEKEVLAYYCALDELEAIVRKQLESKRIKITEKHLQKFHALVMGEGRKRVKATAYRDGQNVVKDSSSGLIVYLPPESKDVPILMKELIDWIDLSRKEGLAAPIIAAIAHFQFATIHPYYDGNGRTARLLATLILHLENYSLRGLYSLEEYYAKDLTSYYSAFEVAKSHNYYFGRNNADLTAWIEFFCEGMIYSLEKICHHSQDADIKRNAESSTGDIRDLDARQRKVLGLFAKHRNLQTKDICKLLKLKDRSVNDLCQKWVDQGFIEMADASKKARKYRLAPLWQNLY